jgi:hypothetical protein
LYSRKLCEAVLRGSEGEGGFWTVAEVEELAGDDAFARLGRVHPVRIADPYLFGQVGHLFVLDGLIDRGVGPSPEDRKSHVDISWAPLWRAGDGQATKELRCSPPV